MDAMKEPLVSVCMGTYNREQTIRESLDSVLLQKYGHLEVVVVDNASTDRTVEILRGYGDRIRLIRREVNSGMCSTTRNEAVRNAHGDYIAFLDSDDCWYPDKIARQVEYLEKNPGIPLCHSYCRIMDARSIEAEIRHEGLVPSTGNCFDALLDHCWITISTVLMRRSLYEECGPFSETLPYGRSGEDWEFFLKVARKHEIGFIPEVLARYRKAGEGISGQDWRGVPAAFPFVECLVRREDIFGGMVSLSRMDEVLWMSAFQSTLFWRGRGMGWRAAYFQAKFLMNHPAFVPAWKELGKSIFRAMVPDRAGKRLA